MAGELQPLAQNFKIVDENGFPTLYFIKWAQQRQIDISEGISAVEAQQLIDDWAAARQVIAGRTLDGGGFLSHDITIDHAESLVTPGTYGDATHVPQFVVDQEGHIQGVVPVAISGGGGGTTPAVVQVKTAIGATSAVTLGAAPTAGNLMIAIATHWTTLSVTAYTNAGWTPMDITNGAVTDGYLLACKYALPGESATQTPFVASASMSTTIFEVSGAAVAIPFCRNAVKEIVATPMTVPLVSPKAGSLLIGISAEAGSNAAFVPSAAFALTIHENVTGVTANNSPRRTQSFSAAGIALGTNTTVSTAFTPGNMVGVGIMLVGG
jgi:hypothetical protein